MMEGAGDEKNVAGDSIVTSWIDNYHFLIVEQEERRRQREKAETASEAEARKEKEAVEEGEDDEDSENEKDDISVGSIDPWQSLDNDPWQSPDIVDLWQALDSDPWESHDIGDLLLGDVKASLPAFVKKASISKKKLVQ